MVSTNFYQMKKGDFVIGVDFGSGQDFSTEVQTTVKEGKITIISSCIIGRAQDFVTKEKREQYLKRYKQ